MANTIQIKRSSTASDVPTVGQLEQGELALNIVDEKLYSKNSSDAIFEIGGAGIADGTVEGQMLRWDVAGDEWEATDNMLYQDDGANPELLFYTAAGATLSGSIQAVSNHLQIVDSANVLAIDVYTNLTQLANNVRIEGGYLEVSNTAANASIKMDMNATAGALEFSPQLGSPTRVELNGLDLGILGQGLAAEPTAVADECLIWACDDIGTNALYSTTDQMTVPLDNVHVGTWRWHSVLHTGSAPSATLFRTDSATCASITEIALPDLDLFNDNSDWFTGDLEVGDVLTIRGTSDRDTWVSVSLDVVTDNTTWWELEVTVLKAGTVAFTNAEHYQFELQKTSAVSGAGTYLPLAGGSMDAGSHTIFPLENDAATPTLAFGDGDSGFYESADDSLRVAIAGGAAWVFSSGIMGTNNSARAAILNESPTSTNPNLIPAQTDVDTGIGSAAADQLSLVAGGVEILRAVETGTATTDQVIIGPAGIIGAAATPALAFGDGDTGFYESADDTLVCARVGADVWQTDSAYIIRGAGSAEPGLVHENASATNPTFLPSRSDTDTGIGSNATDQLSLIAGGVEMLRLQETGVATTDQLIIGPAGVIGAKATPSLAFGDGDSGFYEAADDSISLSLAGNDVIDTTPTLITLQQDTDLSDNQLRRAILHDYSITGESFTPTGTTQTLTYSNGQASEIDLESVTGNATITLSGGPPAGEYGQMTVKIRQDGATARTLTWAGGTFVWRDGTAHVMSAAVDSISIYTFETWDEGTTWYAAGADYS